MNRGSGTIPEYAMHCESASVQNNTIFVAHRVEAVWTEGGEMPV